LDYINKVMMEFVFFTSIRNVIFFIMIFALRKVNDDFNIAEELRQVCIVSGVFLTLYSYVIIFQNTTSFVVMGWCEYLLMSMSLALLYLTAFDPILRTYKPKE
jgi:hypothetical protein